MPLYFPSVLQLQRDTTCWESTSIIDLGHCNMHVTFTCDPRSNNNASRLQTFSPALHFLLYYSGPHMRVRDAKLVPVSFCTAVTSRMRRSERQPRFLKRHFCSVITLCSSVKLCVWASAIESNSCTALVCLRVCWLPQSQGRAWVIRLCGTGAVATKRRLMLVAMHVGCRSVTGWIHGNEIMSLNRMQINSSAHPACDAVKAAVFELYRSPPKNTLLSLAIQKNHMQNNGAAQT